MTVLADSGKLVVQLKAGASEHMATLAFAALAGLIALRTSGKMPLLGGAGVPVVSAALLCVSLYSGFLLRDSLSLAVEAGAIDSVRGIATSTPLVFQFWSLLGAIGLLSGWLLGKNKLAAVVSWAALLPSSAGGMETSKDPRGACVREWAATRKVAVSEESAEDLQAAIAQLQEDKRLRIKAEDACAYTHVLLDIARQQTHELPANERDEALNNKVSELRAAAEDRGFSAGDLLRRVIEVGELWRVPSGLLNVKASDPPVRIIVYLQNTTQEWQGVTECLMRLPPGDYSATAARAGRTIASRRFKIAAGSRVEWAVPERIE